MARHLKIHEEIDGRDRRHILHLTRKRPMTKILEKEKENYKRKLKKCPFEECQLQLPYMRLDNHLKQFHMLNRDDDLYKKYIRRRKLIRKSVTKDEN